MYKRTITLNQTSDAIPEIERSQVCQGKVIYGNYEHQNAVLVLCEIIFTPHHAEVVNVLNDNSTLDNFNTMLLQDNLEEMTSSTTHMVIHFSSHKLSPIFANCNHLVCLQHISTTYALVLRVSLNRRDFCF